MRVAVYPRLAAILEERHLSVDDLGRQIAERYGVTVDPGTLRDLMQAAPVERADLAAAGAAAALLGIGLDDLFSVQAWPALLDLPEPEPVLSPEKGRRLEDLFDCQDDGTITDAETAEIQMLVAENGRLLHERSLLEIAAKRGQPVDVVRADLAADLAKAVEWLETFKADPERQRALEAAAKRHHSSRPLLFEG